MGNRFDFITLSLPPPSRLEQRGRQGRGAAVSQSFQNLVNQTYLDLVHRLHLCTSGSSSSPFQPVHCGIFPRDRDSFRILLKCFTSCHLDASSSSPATTGIHVIGKAEEAKTIRVHPQDETKTID